MAANKKRKHLPIILALTIALIFSLVIAALTYGTDIALLNPKGLIANEQNWLLITSTLIMLGFGVPVILTLYFFSWRYREDGPNQDYSPKKNTSKAMLAFMWGGPLIIVIILASIMLPATQRLEPQKPIATDKDQLTIQVVSMNWKWLFIYPDQNIASVNFAQIPVDTPVRFELTADEAPMSSFWVPHLAGMLYTMTGHVNPLHLMADTVGDYPGASAEISGTGFAGMKFTTRVSTQEDFDAWVATTKQSQLRLDDEEYEKLLIPSEYNEPVYYAGIKPNLYSGIVGKYSSDHAHTDTGAYNVHSNKHEEHGSH